VATTKEHTMTATTLPTTIDSTVAAAPASAPSRTTWKIDSSHSLVEFSVRHMMITTVKGRFAEVEGSIELDEANHTNSSVDVQISAASIDTRSGDRDAHLRSADFLDAENHPYLTFRSSKVEQDGDEYKVTGDLTIRGVTRQVVLDTELTGFGTTPYGAKVAGFSAKTKINRKDYGLNWNVGLEAGGVLVGDEVKISLEIQASQPA
jgi:polyisoprenoid-binding protein YceI